jgi:hypothetical protein
MPTFLWSGRGVSGQEEAADVEADTPAEARKILEARGWTNLRLHTTEAGDFAARQVLVERPVDGPKPTPIERVRHHEGTAPGFWRHWGQSMAMSAIAILVLVACIVFLATHGRPGIYRDTRVGVGVIGLLVLVSFPVFFWRWLNGTKRLRVEMLAARRWHRWEEMLQCVDKLREAGRDTRIKLGDYNLGRYRALALAGLGRVEEALTWYQNAAIEAKTPSWLAHETRASIYVAARQYDRALECYRQALEEEPDKPTVCIDTGTFLVQRFNFPGEAKQLLARAEKAQLSELEQIYVPYLRGIIAFREKDHAAMDKNMREALAEFERRAAKQLHIFEGAVLLCKGYLAVSSAALGRKDEARKYFAKAEKYLRVIGLDDVLKEYEVLMAAPR